MKKLFAYIIIMTFLISCGGSSKSDNDIKDDQQCPNPVTSDGSSPQPLPNC